MEVNPKLHKRIQQFFSKIDASRQMGPLIRYSHKHQHLVIPGPSHFHLRTSRDIHCARLLELYDSDSFFSTQLVDRLRPQHEDKLRPQHEDKLRPQHENKLRPQHENKLRPQHEDKLRPQHEDKLRPQHIDKQQTQYFDKQQSQQIDKLLAKQRSQQKDKYRPEHVKKIRPQPTISLHGNAFLKMMELLVTIFNIYLESKEHKSPKSSSPPLCHPGSPGPGRDITPRSPDERGRQKRTAKTDKPHSKCSPAHRSGCHFPTDKKELFPDCSMKRDNSEGNGQSKRKLPSSTDDNSRIQLDAHKKQKVAGLDGSSRCARTRVWTSRSGAKIKC